MVAATTMMTIALVSMYAPSLGGINCDADCGVMASGNAPYEGALSCPPEIPLGTIITLEYEPAPGIGTELICEDRGGMVQGSLLDLCITDGDVAERAHQWGRRPIQISYEVQEYGRREDGTGRNVQGAMVGSAGALPVGSTRDRNRGISIR